VHRVHHQREGRIDESTSLFRVKIFDQGHRTFNVGKEGSNGFAFAVGRAPGLQCILFSPNPLG
jgi:hypothetical protein